MDGVVCQVVGDMRDLSDEEKFKYFKRTKVLLLANIFLFGSGLNWFFEKRKLTNIIGIFFSCISLTLIVFVGLSAFGIANLDINNIFIHSLSSTLNIGLIYGALAFLGSFGIVQLLVDIEFYSCALEGVPDKFLKNKI